jgi:hypothetical protein
MTLAEALEELSERVESTKLPTLSPETLRRILRRTTRVKNFVVGAAYQRGQFLAPASASLDTYTGAVYLVTTSGISDAEPSWGSSALSSGPVQLAYFGPCEVFDLHEATREGWKAKMSAAARMVSEAHPDQKNEWQQVFEHCERRWKACGPAVVVG